LFNIELGPSCTPKDNKASDMTALVPEPGIPNVSKGTKEPVHAVLFALKNEFLIKEKLIFYILRP